MRVRAAWLGLVMALVSLGGCGATDDSSLAERHELANTSPLSATPKSSGKTLVRTFQTFCLTGSSDAADRTKRLRQAGFVPAAGWSGGLREFVTNDSRPAVRISRDGRLCAVNARAQTGQNVAIQNAITAWFPHARSLKTRGQDEIWQIGPNDGIATKRGSRGPHYNEIMLARIQLK